MGAVVQGGGEVTVFPVADFVVIVSVSHLVKEAQCLCVRERKRESKRRQGEEEHEREREREKKIESE